MDRMLQHCGYLLIVWFSIYSGAVSAVAGSSVDVGVVGGIERELRVIEGRLAGRFAPPYRCVFDQLEGEFNFIEMPLAQILYQLDNGQIAVGLPLVQTSARDSYADFGGRLFQTEYVYLFLEDLPPLSQTSGLTYSFVRRFVGEDLMRGDAVNMLPVSEWRQAVEMLKLGRANVVVLPWVLVEKLMEGFEGQYFVRTARWVDLSLYVSHAHSDSQISENLRRAIRQCRYYNDAN